MNTPDIPEHPAVAAVDRLTFTLPDNGRVDADGMGSKCGHCQLWLKMHINDKYCPEWRLRQLDGDR